ncbi:MAG: valine--tRNA ligase, partial [Endomicrobium sp.]|nr:valine--tRNA ligase [Endomicrobium sp.]
KIWEWKKETGNIILGQLKKLGCGLDWDRVAFTMDKSRSKSVKKAFICLFDKGLIYRGKKLVNWCLKCGTALSDIEVEYKNEKRSLWYIKYPLKSSDEYLVVATTRPETVFGDVAVAVNPEDERYKKLIGKIVKLPLVNREIKVIPDYIVDKFFGTGAVKITPAHDAIDNQIARRNNLGFIEIINTSGKMMNVPLRYQNLTVEEAKIEVVEDLKAMGFLIKVEDYICSLGRCYRCYTKIEPLMSEQWFLSVGELSKKAIDATNHGRIFFHPKSWEKSYVLWLENLKDWCISRQIWWGHRIPVYYCVDKKGNKTNCKPVASLDKPTKCCYCSSKNFTQDEDVLDTWFSSALWPISVFDWGENENNEDLKYFYPTSVLATGHEILYLWVARMVQFGLEFMNNIPYNDVLIHGIVRDKQGKKMSKSLGNVVDPIVVIEQYGTDALRFALSKIAVQGRDMQISEKSFLVSRNFANKIWNASRFIVINLKNVDKLNDDIHPIELADQWIITEFIDFISKTVSAYESYNVDIVARNLYDFFWKKYCDWYIELSKIRISSTDLNVRRQVLSILSYILKSILKLMSPIMPFITSEIWEILSKNTPIKHVGGNCTANNPKTIIDNLLEGNFNALLCGYKCSIEKMNFIQDIIIRIRTLRNEMNISPEIQLGALFSVLNNDKRELIKANENYVKRLAKISTIKFEINIVRPKNSAFIIGDGIEIFLPLEGLIDINKEKARLIKEIVLAKQEIKATSFKLQNEKFVQRAPKSEIEKVKMRFSEAKLKIEKINENLKIFG